MDLFLLHIPEKHIGLDGFRHKMSRAQQLLHRTGLRLLGVEQIIPGAQDADDIVHILPAHGETGKAALPDGLQDLLPRILQPEDGHVRAVDHDLLRGDVVKLKDVLDQLFFAALDGAALLAVFHHQADLILADFLQLGLGIDAEQPQHQPRQPKQGGGDGMQQAGKQQREAEGPSGGLFRPVPGVALRRKIAQSDGQQHQHDPAGRRSHRAPDALRRQLGKLMHQLSGQRIGDSKKTESHCAHAQGGTEVIRLLNDRQQPGCLFIAVFRSTGQLALAAFADSAAGQGTEYGQKNKDTLDEDPSSNRVRQGDSPLK